MQCFESHMAPPNLMRSRRGVTIIMVIVIGMMLLAMVVILLSGGSDSREKVFNMKEKYHSLFLAKGGQQHALLKFRLLPTPFYDAAAYAIGKNPYFDFTRKMDRQNNPGPMFFTGDVTVEENVITDGDREMLLITRSGEWGFSAEDKKFEGVMATHLNRYLKDIRSGYPVPKPVVQINSEKHNDLAMGQDWHDPYSGNYLVDRVFIFGSQGALSYSTDSVMVSCKGVSSRSNHKSLITLSNGKPKDLSRIFQKHTGKAQAGAGFQDQIDEVSNSDKFEALKKDFTDDFESAQRGEAVTSVYEVRREK